jgi:phosphoacetylglucosamine mutase
LKAINYRTLFCLSVVLQAEWEVYATRLANTPLDKLGEVYEELVKEINVKADNPARVVFGRDTRASGSRLVSVLSAALTATNVEFTDFKYMTTPQLHYIVRCKNTLGTPYEYGEPTEEGYYRKLSNAFKTVMQGRTITGPVTVDCANGVGGPKLEELIKYLPTAKEGGIDIVVVNDNVINPDSLNFEVSASFGQCLALDRGSWICWAASVARTT